MKLISLSLILNALAFSMMAYIHYAGSRMITRYEPLIEFSKELKFEATQAHLWFAGRVSGERNESIDTVWQHLDIASWYAKAMLGGGKKGDYQITALKDQDLTNEVRQVRNKLISLRESAEQWNNLQLQPGSELMGNQELDKVFQDFILKTNHVEKKIHDKIQTDLIDFRKTGASLLLAAALLALSITFILFKNQRRNIRQIAKIKAAKKIIEEKNSNLQTMAHYDFLTNLPNRALFVDLLKQAIANAQRNQQCLVLFFIDLDHFKAVNDSFGHQAGDGLLQLVAKRLSQLLRAGDSVARLSGDEFTVLLAPEDTEQLALNCANSVVKKMQTTLSERYDIEGVEIYVSASIGVALYPKDGECVASILKNADRSMYDVKQKGKNSYRFFSTDLGAFAERKLQMESDLRKAIHGNELELYYQPQWDFKTGELFGLEALVRWNHPQQGLLHPDEFIGTAEQSGLIYQLDMWVLGAVCKQLKQWQCEAIFSNRVSINMSALQFSSPDLVENIVSLLAQYEVNPNRLEIEIVESILMQDSEHTLTSLAALKDLGIHIAVDDFGTGYSAMAYLSKFPIDVLKIDKMFVNDIGSNIASRVIVESIIKMATKLGLTIVAEGIETEEQSRFLASRGCTFAQGYFYNKPMSVNDVEALLQVA